MEIRTLPPLPKLPSKAFQQLHHYASLLCATNDRVRLTGPHDEETLWYDHIEDCLHILPLLPSLGTVVDVGTGGGLPGAVLAVCRSDLKFTLLDSLSRKTKVLTEIIAALKLSNTEVICARSEDFAASRRECYDAAVIRAVSEAGVIAEYLAPLVRKGGVLIAMKGPSVSTELAPLKGRWHTLGLSEPELYEYNLKKHKNYMLLWQKHTLCPTIYPRKPGRAEKKLWWR